jgi:hypothetical protein
VSDGRELAHLCCFGAHEAHVAPTHGTDVGQPRVAQRERGVRDAAGATRLPGALGFGLGGERDRPVLRGHAQPHEATFERAQRGVRVRPAQGHVGRRAVGGEHGEVPERGLELARDDPRAHGQVERDGVEHDDVRAPHARRVDGSVNEAEITPRLARVERLIARRAKDILRGDDGHARRADLIGPGLVRRRHGAVAQLIAEEHRVAHGAKRPRGAREVERVGGDELVGPDVLISVTRERPEDEAPVVAAILSHVEGRMVFDRA